MKRIIGLLAIVGMLAIPSVSFAASDQIGIYVAPKFVYGLTQMKSIKMANYDEYLAGSGDGTGSSGNMGSSTDNTFGGSIAIGYDFSKKFNVPIRTELEYAAFSTAKAKHYELVVAPPPSPNVEDLWMEKSFQIQTLFLNAYWDIKTGTQFTPYVGAGLGIGFIDTKLRDWGASYNLGYDPSDPLYDYDPFSYSFSKRGTNFAWNLSAGLGYDITDNWTIDAGYRFVSYGSVNSAKEQGEGSDGVATYYKTKNLYQHQFALGIRYTF